MIIHKIKEIMLYLWDEYKKTTILVFVAIILEVLYLLYTVFKYSVNTEDQGTLVQKNPISLNNRITPSLQSDSRSYEYGISMWVNIQPQSPDISPSSTIFTSILNYSNVPNITYNSSLNTLRVTMREQNNKIIVIADITNISLQTWNSIIINYANGIMDIFYNGILIKSRLNIIPYATKTTLTIGTNSGVIGEIAQVRFFDKVISEKKIKINIKK